MLVSYSTKKLHSSIDIEVNDFMGLNCYLSLGVKLIDMTCQMSWQRSMSFYSIQASQLVKYCSELHFFS